MTKHVSFANNITSYGGEVSFMSKMRKITGNISTTTLVAIGFCLLFIAFVIFYYLNYLSPKLKPKYTEGNTNNTTENKKAELMLFYVDWCPHCKTAKPIWQELKTEYKDKQINGYTVIFTEINCTNESPEIEDMMNKYKIEGYPTIKLLKDGQVIEYDAKPNKSTLDQFLNTVL